MHIPSKVLENISRGYRENAQVVSFSLEECLAPGDNFMSEMCNLRLQIHADEETGQRTEEVDVMLKCLPEDPLCSQIVDDCDSFAKEVGMYTRVFKDMVSFQKSMGFEENEIFEGWPRAFAAEVEGDFKYLAMENLRVPGFKMTERSVMLDTTKSKLVLQGLARFHALSLAMFEGQHHSILSTYPFLKEQMFRKPSDISASQKTFVKMAFASVSAILQNAKEFQAIETWESLNEDLKYFEIMHKLVGSPVKSAVITFGDCWKNNILFRHEAPDNTPVEVAFVDFQLARASSRIIDVAYFMYTSVELDILNEREAELLKYYHQEFKSFLRKLGLVPKKFGCTWKRFKKEYEKYRLYGVVVGLMLAPALYSTPHNSQDDPAGVRRDSSVSVSSFVELIDESDNDNSEVTRRICNIATKHLPRCNW